jgi:hypothetical protein
MSERFRGTLAIRQGEIERGLGILETNRLGGVSPFEITHGPYT